MAVYKAKMRNSARLLNGDKLVINYALKACGRTYNMKLILEADRDVFISKDLDLLIYYSLIDDELTILEAHLGKYTLSLEISDLYDWSKEGF